MLACFVRVGLVNLPCTLSGLGNNTVLLPQSHVIQDSFEKIKIIKHLSNELTSFTLQY